MKRVLVTAGFFAPHKGGTERFCEELSRALGERSSVTVLTTNTEGAPPEERIGSYTVVRLPAATLFSGRYPVLLPTPSFFVLMAGVLSERIDLVVTNTRFFQTTFLGYLIGVLWGIPLLHIEHGASHIIFESILFERMAHCIDHLSSSLLFRKAERVGAVSAASQDFVRHLGFAGAVERIPNFVDTRLFMPGQKGAMPTVVYVGRVIEQKGLGDLVAVWPSIRSRVEARLLIVGAGKARERLASGASEGVLFLGEREHHDVARMLAESDVFVNPSLAEGLPTSVLEACACGLPVVATDVGGTGEVIEREWLVSPRDRRGLEEKLLRLLGDPKLRSTVGSRNRRTVEERYSLDAARERFARFTDI